MQDNTYFFDSRVRYSEIDHNQKLTLPGVINYFQDCTTFHSEDIGRGLNSEKNKNGVWILSSWQVVVKRYPVMAEKIRIFTRATGFKSFLGDRSFKIEDQEGNILAYANSLWVFMDREKGRPMKPDKEILDDYGVGEPFATDFPSRKIGLPKESEERDAFEVKRHHIDTNEHVNNCQYVQMALDVLGEGMEVSELRVEYKKSAVLGDMIYPRVAREEDRIVVLLDGEDGDTYAVVELK